MNIPSGMVRYTPPMHERFTHRRGYEDSQFMEPQHTQERQERDMQITSALDVIPRFCRERMTKQYARWLFGLAVAPQRVSGVTLEGLFNS